MSIDLEEVSRAHYFPVRHHSPRTTAALGSFLGEHRPALVLVEGPSDAHELIDVPAAQSLSSSDEPREKADDGSGDPYELCARARRFRSFEEFWEASFEAPRYEPAQFREALIAFADFSRSRRDRPRDRARDAYMASRVAAELARGVAAEKIVVVLGAAHVAALVSRDVDPELVSKLPEPVPSQVTLVPFSYPRLAEQTGYGAGNRAPFYYQRAHAAGCDYRRAGLEVLIDFAQHLRLRGYAASMADTIEAYRLAVSLTGIRDKAEPGLDELREAALATLCRGEEAIVALLWPSLIGRKVGKVASRIGRNSLQDEFWREVKERRLPQQDSPESFALKLNNEVEVGTSVFLHRLRIADAPCASYLGSQRYGAGSASSDEEPGGYAALSRTRETWEAQWTPATDAALVEKIALGDTLEQVATRVLQGRLQSATSTGPGGGRSSRIGRRERFPDGERGARGVGAVRGDRRRPGVARARLSRALRARILWNFPGPLESGGRRPPGALRARLRQGRTGMLPSVLEPAQALAERRHAFEPVESRRFPNGDLAIGVDIARLRWQGLRWNEGGAVMKTTRCSCADFMLGLAGILGAAVAAAGQEVAIDSDDLGGVVESEKGPEAGVWVIAETTELPTRYVKIVVTDEAGRYLLPDLPQARHNVWVRGYGLVDSPEVQASPGTRLNLRAVPAPSPRAAAEYYPAAYWLSLLHVPEASEFPGTGPEGNGISPNMKSQAEWLRVLKSGNCTACHQLGNHATRTIPAEFEVLGSIEAWERRLQSGQAGGNMMSGLNQLGRERALAVLADWTDRIAKGELPPAPPRPEGLERNVVITAWDWADPKAYLHDEVSTDRRNPTLNANGLIYGALELSADYLPVLDPVRHKADHVPLTVRDPETPPTSPEMLAPSPYWGDEVLWTSRNNVHNPMLDERGRVWITSAVRPPANPDFCREGSSHPSAKLFPIPRASRHLAVYDPKTEKLTHISTCFSTHHLMFAEDENNTLWTSGGGQVVGWLNTRLFDETGDEVASQGWTALILDTNGNGKRDDYVEPDEPLDPAKDKRFGGAFYSVAPARDGSIWGSVLGFPGAAVRLDPGANPPETALAEVYEPPWRNAKAPVQGFSPRGMDVGRDGVVWAALASGHLASFDRRKCKGPLNGPEATGQHCPEGWTLYPEPAPQLRGVVDSGSAEASYYTWVDWFGTLGLGENVPINTGNASEALLVLKDEKWIVFRVPYPLGFYTKWLDGRIDDPDAGWKGRGLWATVSTRAPFHMEGGKGTTSKVLKFQLRPDPLAR